MADAPELVKRERIMIATRQEMKDAELPLHLRDFCAHLLIPLYQCRRDTYHLPWKCKEEMEAWQHCQVEDYYLRMKEKERQKLVAKLEAEKAKEAETKE